MSGSYGGQLNSGEAFKQSTLGKSSAIAGQSMNQGASFAPTLPQYESGGDSGTTYATLSEGRLNIGGKATTVEELGIHSDAATAHQKLNELPDIQQVLDKQQTIAAATADIASAVKTFSGNMADKAAKEQQQAYDQLQTAIKNQDNQAIAAAMQRYNQAEQSAKDWGIGGSNSRALNAVTTVVTGALGGQSGLKTATNALAPYAAETIGQTFGQNGSNPNEAAQLLSHAILAGVVAATNGGDFTTGAVAGTGAEAAAKAITLGLYGEEAAANPNSLSETQKENIKSLSAAVGALVGGVADDSSLNAQIGGVVAQNAVENNYLTEKQVWAYADALKEHCQSGNEQACVDVKKTYAALDSYQRQKLVNICTTAPQTKGCADLIGGAQSGDWAVITESDNYPRPDPSKPGKEALHLLCGNNQTCRDEITRQDLRNNLDQSIVERNSEFLKRTADGYRNGALGKILDFRGMNDQEVIDHAKSAMYASVGIIGSIGKSKVGNQWNASDKNVIWVKENAHMGSKARSYNDAATGARSNIQTKQGEAPALERTLADGSKKLVRFDGVENNILIDRKISVVTTPKAKDQAIRQSQALKENGMTGRWEVSSELQANRANKLLKELNIKNISVKVVKP
ncbi:VENN motif pre-toxin domain-containing protein [Neisseria arctica]|uniref:VENN motif pre-toxin domain-containing protein n=1 Tax=Neisseria arctica TaxID=1470200 RepID=UPI00069ABB2D|nr:VENN motif pre-toxin domain-containing protein [Neisseria arctica]UOO87161.1 VENN motif pre-toxin domain-containing protein [Neisseria arctica]